MKTVVLLYDSSCIYEIVILNYFLKVTGRDVVFASPDGNAITAMEGYSINTAGVLNAINPTDVELLIVPGASHTDLYDGGGKNAIPFDRIESFFRKNLK